jgi:hypothetical protein
LGAIAAGPAGAGWVGDGRWGMGGGAGGSPSARGSVAMPIVPHHPWYVVMDH